MSLSPSLSLSLSLSYTHTRARAHKHTLWAKQYNNDMLGLSLEEQQCPNNPQDHIHRSNWSLAHLALPYQGKGKYHEKKEQDISRPSLKKVLSKNKNCKNNIPMHRTSTQVNLKTDKYQIRTNKYDLLLQQCSCKQCQHL